MPIASPCCATAAIVGERDAEVASIEEMVRLMVGEDALDAVEHAPRTTGPVASGSRA